MAGSLDPTIERYLRLGLELDRHVDGTVDAWFGPAGLAEEVRAGRPPEPGSLVTKSAELLAELPDGWLRDQVVGLRTFAGILAGEARSFADEVTGCYGVEAAHTDEGVFAAAHDQAAALLPGSGPLADRHERWRAAMTVPPDLVERTLAAAVDVAREGARALVDLPDGEALDLVIVRDKPWLAYNTYLGGRRSRVSVNVDVPMSALDLLQTVVHETYPGHHLERCCKERLLVDGRGLLEESMVLVPTPQSLITEGIAQVAQDLAFDSETGPVLAELVRETGVDLDLEHALAVERALKPCRWAEVNAAIMLHEDGATEDEVRAYLRRWGPMSEDLAAHMVRFFRDPTSRTYVVTYPAGYALCRAFVGGDPDRFRTLLTEQVRVGELTAAEAATRQA